MITFVSAVSPKALGWNQPCLFPEAWGFIGLLFFFFYLVCFLFFCSFFFAFFSIGNPFIFFSILISKIKEANRNVPLLASLLRIFLKLLFRFLGFHVAVFVENGCRQRLFGVLKVADENLVVTGVCRFAVARNCHADIAVLFSPFHECGIPFPRLCVDEQYIASLELKAKHDGDSNSNFQHILSRQYQFTHFDHLPRN